jgi:monoamine oxidase
VHRRCAVALTCAGQYFGDVKATAAAFAAAYTHDWQRDPFARGASSYVLVGGERARQTLATPVDGVLWFAGEATAAGGEGGTVAGALQSGMRAARRIVAEG